MPYTYESRKLPLYAACFTGLTPMPHIHFHLELIYLLEGKSVTFTDEEEHFMEAGDLYLSFPNQIHYYHDQKPIRGVIAIFSADVLPEFTRIIRMLEQ